MKIDSSIKSVPSSPIQEERSKPAKQDAGTALPSGRGSVQLSPLSSQLQVIEAGLGDTNVVDAQRVAEIKQAISEGRFSINAGVVADRLIETVRELIRAHKA